MIAIISAIASKLPLAFLERWITYLEKRQDTDTARLVEMLKEIMESKKLQTQIILAEQNKWYTAMIRPLLALPIIIYVWKVVVWDKVLGWGVTDPLDQTMGWVLTTIVGAYFIGRAFEKSKIIDKATDMVEKMKGLR